MGAHIYWWVLAVILIGAELMTGTFYLLVIGVAFAIGGAVAAAGAGLPVQLAVAAVLSVGGVILAHRWRLARQSTGQMRSLDIGQEVRVHDWRADGRARVAYRGSQWDAELETQVTPRQDRMFITAVRGSILILSDRRPAA